MGLLAGKIVCITGSSRGIGRACALGSAKHGATGLLLHYLGDQESKAELLSLKEEIEVAPGVQSGPGDVADPETAQRVTLLPPCHPTLRRSSVTLDFSDQKKLGVLVSNAGIRPFAGFLRLPHETWERTKQVNVDGSNQMKRQTPQGGFMSSISALVGGEFQCCAIALVKYNIRCNAILPGTITTDINKEDLAYTEKRECMIKRTALGRIGLTSPSMRRGAQLLVDGGLFVNFQ
ncbi:hypothetical protein V8E55_000570 [Tylopilus felleus]